MTYDLEQAYRAWLGESIPSWLLLPRNLITVLVETEIGREEGLRVSAGLGRSRLDPIPAFRATHDLLLAIDAAGLAPPDTTGDLDPFFLEQAGQGAPSDLMAYASAALGLMQLTRVRTEGIALTAEGKALAGSLRQDDDCAGRFFADLVTVTLSTFNLGYLDELGVEGYPQSHIVLVLYLPEQIGREPHGAAELARLASMPTEIPDPGRGDLLASAFEMRALRYLVWLDVMSQEPDGLYRLTETFDALFTFDIPTTAMDGRPN